MTMTLPNSWNWSSSSSGLRSLADSLSDHRAAVDADEVDEEDHEHGDEGDKDVDEGDDHHLVEIYKICLHSHCQGEIEKR